MKKHSHSKKTRDEWEKIVEESKDYEGTIEEYCRLKGVSRSNLYKRKKAAKEKSEVTFTKINIKEENQNEKSKKLNNNESLYVTDKNHTIKIEIGKAKIMIDSSDRSTISFIMKELSTIC